MKVLLTGAFGNIGSHVLTELVRRGHDVRCFALDTTEDRKRASTFHGIETIWGDIRDYQTVEAAVAGVDVVLHLAAVIPPTSELDVPRAAKVNVEGTRNVVTAALAQSDRPKLLFASTFDVHGRTMHRKPPRRVDDPLEATDGYTAQKIEAEQIVRQSGLTWFIPRFADVPVIGERGADPIMFEIGLDNRIEVLHPDDAAVALANALETPQVWGRVLFVGGGETCQVTYRDYLARMLRAMGMKPLPEKAFSGREYVTDWVDTEESQRLLQYQNHSFDDITDDIAGTLGWKRWIVPVVKPLVRRSMLKMSPYR
ncbi:NAD-dependent epimerase/dehydratase family protein [Rhodococcus globerulus]|uniref:NAD(P)-dependent oxidoreductase n=1 Tax=Rhodococcus globerulus TaxID=33008 RepID=A0ABU4C365_RHOGO|nr:NAD(P)-dependent oxidoreductase [Rhodococcus globerulus]MDV6270859.1 NAD(P)-dependent oxidoreductase [Rhodococcus globerulus]